MLTVTERYREGDTHSLTESGRETNTKIKEKQEQFMQTEEINNTTQVDEPADADLID